jgi:hypothetical protein
MTVGGEEFRVNPWMTILHSAFLNGDLTDDSTAATESWSFWEYARLEARACIHKSFCAVKKTGSELIFLRTDFKISFFPFLQMLFTKNVSVLADFLKKIDLFEKN